MYGCRAVAAGTGFQGCGVRWLTFVLSVVRPEIGLSAFFRRRNSLLATSGHRLLCSHAHHCVVAEGLGGPEGAHLPLRNSRACGNGARGRSRWRHQGRAARLQGAEPPATDATHRRFHRTIEPWSGWPGRGRGILPVEGRPRRGRRGVPLVLAAGQARAQVEDDLSHPQRLSGGLIRLSGRTG